MQARIDVTEARWATSVGTARYVGRSRQWLIDHLGPYLHEVRIGGDRMYDLREVDEVLRRLASAPRASLPPDASTGRPNEAQ